MNPQWTPTWSGDFLKKEIIESGWDDNVKVKILHEKQRAEELIQKLWDSEDAQQAFENVRLATVGALKELRFSTAHQLEDFRHELDSKNDSLSDWEITQEELNVVSEYVDDLERLDVETSWRWYALLPENLSHLADLPFKDYGNTQAQAMLEHYQRAYTTYRSVWAIAGVSENDSWKNISSQGWLRAAQEILINIWYGDWTYENGFSQNWEYLVGFSSEEGGNHVRRVSEFEQILSEWWAINPLMFTNYVKYQKQQNGWDIWIAFGKISKLCWERLDLIEDLIKDTDTWNIEIHEVKQELINTWNFSEEQWLIWDAISGLRDLFYDSLWDTIVSINQSIVTSMEWVGEALERINNITTYSIAGKNIGSLLWEGNSQKLNSYISYLQRKCSSENTQTQLFSISKTIHEIWVNICPDNFRWNFFENAHNEATKALLKSMIEWDESLAIWYDSDKWYFVKTESDFLTQVNNNHWYISDSKNKTEVWTYLAWLKWNTSSILEKLWKNNLIPLFTKFKDFNFWGESFSGEDWSKFYSTYMNWYENNMLRTIKDTINTSDAWDINEIIAGWEMETEAGDILAKCNICGQISKYDNISDIRYALNSATLQASNPDFHKGLQEKLRILENAEDVKASFENYYINAGVPESLITWELSDELEALLSELEWNTCSIDYIRKIHEFNTTHLSDYNIWLNEEQAWEIITSLMQRNQEASDRALIDIKYQLTWITWASSEEIQRYFDMPEEERNRHLWDLLEQVPNQESREDLRMRLIEQFDFREDIQLQKRRSNEVIAAASNIYQSFWQPSLEHILSYPEDIRFIKDADKLLKLFQENGEDLRGKIELKDVQLNLLYNADIVSNFPWDIDPTDVRLIPDSVLNKYTVIINLIKSSLKHDEGRVIRDLLYAYGAAYWEDLRLLVDELYVLIQELPAEQQVSFRQKIPRNILYAANADILWVPENNTEFQDASYYLQLAKNLPHQNWIDEHRGIWKIYEIDHFLEYKDNSHDILKILCAKGLLWYTNFAKYQIWKDPTLWGEIIDNWEITDIRYINAQTRASEGFQNRLFSSPRFQKWWDQSWIEEYVTLSSINNEGSSTNSIVRSIQSAHRWWSFLEWLDSAPSIQEIISQHPEILSSINGALSYMTPEVYGELSAEEEDFFFRMLQESEDYSKIDTLREPLWKLKQKQEALDNQEYQEKVTRLVDSQEWINNTDRERLLFILSDPDPVKILSYWPDLNEILGWEEEALEFLEAAIKLAEEEVSRSIEDAGKAPRNTSDYPQNFANEYLKESPNWDSVLDTEKLTQLWGILFSQNKDYFIEMIKERNFEWIKNTIREYLNNTFPWISEKNIDELIEIIYWGINLDITHAARNKDWGVNPDIFWDPNNFWNNVWEGIWSKYEWYSLSPDGSIQVSSQTSPTPIPTLEATDIASPDLQDTYREISSELNLTEQEQQTLTKEELEMIAGNETVRENFIWFRSKLIELNLEWLWSFRNVIFSSIGSIALNANDGDYLGENEMNIFLSNIMYATTKDNRFKPMPGNIVNTYELIREVNKSEWFTAVEDVNSYGDSIVVTSFRNQFAPYEANFLSFDREKFKKALHS